MTWEEIKLWIKTLPEDDQRQQAEVLVGKDRNGYNGEFLKIRGNCVNFASADNEKNRPYLTVGDE